MKIGKQKQYKWIKIGGYEFQFDQAKNAVYYGNDWRFVEATADGSLFILFNGSRRYFDAEPQTYSMIRIEFEDCGQDFLAWEIDYNTGELKECTERVPVASSKWKGLFVDEPQSIKAGGLVSVTIKKRPISAKSKMITVKYKISKVTKIK